MLKHFIFTEHGNSLEGAQRVFLQTWDTNFGMCLYIYKYVYIFTSTYNIYVSCLLKKNQRDNVVYWKTNRKINNDLQNQKVMLLQKLDLAVSCFDKNSVPMMCCFVVLTRGWGTLETRPPVALGSFSELFAFTMSLASPVSPSLIFLTDTETL